MEPDEELRIILSRAGHDVPKTQPVTSLTVLPCPIPLADRRTPFQATKRSPIPDRKDDELFLNTLRYLLIQVGIETSQMLKIENLFSVKRNYGAIFSVDNEALLSKFTTLIEGYVNEVTNKH